MSFAILAALWFLATVDAACIGYRTAAGRNALIRKRDYYRQAMLRGAWWGQSAVGLALVILVVMIFSAPQRPRLIADLERAGLAMLAIYVPYAVVIAVGLAFRLIPSVDIRCLTSTLIFGPLVLIRPVVAIAGGIAAVVVAPRSEVAILACSILIMMLGLEPLLDRWFGRAASSAKE